MYRSLNSLIVLFALTPMVRAAEPIVVEGVILRLLEEAKTPAQTPGVLLKLAVREGDKVPAGALLAQIDDAPAQILAEGAKISVDLAKERALNDVAVRFAAKSHEVAVAELQRSEESIARFANSVSQSQLDVERLTVEKTALEQEQAQQDQAAARLKLALKENEHSAAKLEVERRRILAPFAGVVVEVTARAGEWVEPGQQVLRLVNVDRLKAEGFLPAAAAKRIALGAPVRLRGAGLERAYLGKIVFISPEIDPVTNQVRFWAEIDNAAGELRPGELARMEVAQPAAAPPAAAPKAVAPPREVAK